jgi:hypothetical protein
MTRRRVGRPPWPATALFLLVAALAAGLYGGAISLIHRQESSVQGITFVPPAAAAAEPPASSPTMAVFARSDGVALRLLSPDVVAVAFHEASYRDATALRPLGQCDVCRNRWKFDPPAPTDLELSYIVTDTRGRSTPATSAADVVMPPGTAVTSPVTGTVTGVKRYRLYRRYPDVRVEIRPDSAPERRVVLLHLANVRLVRGTRVEAMATRIGTVRGFRFESQVDRYVPGGNPHVHIEVKDPARTPRPPKKP